MKNIISLIFYYSGISYLFFKLINTKDTIRIVNYHCTPKIDEKNFESHIKFFKDNFRNIDYFGFKSFFEYKESNLKPGIIITFDDGLRSNFDFAKPILDNYNFTGWFCIPSSFISNPTLKFAQDNSITYKQSYADGRYGINVNELNILTNNHIIVSHTRSHYRMNEKDDKEVLKNEILNSKIDLENIIKKDVEIFCWVGGEIQHYTKKAYEFIILSGYKYVFTTNNKVINKFSNKYALDRTNIESNYPKHLLLFQLSGLMDFLYIRKRKKLNKNIFSNDFN